MGNKHFCLAKLMNKNMSEISNESRLYKELEDKKVYELLKCGKIFVDIKLEDFKLWEERSV